MNMNAIWEKHKPFLIQVAGGALVFLVMFSIARSYADVSEQQSVNDRGAAGIRKNVGNLQAELRHVREKNGVLDAQFDMLRSKVSIGTMASEVPEDRFSRVFAGRKQEVYQDFIDRADRNGMGRPKQNEINFDEGSDLSPEEWVERFRQLDVLDAALFACVQQRVHRIESISPGSVDFEEVEGDSSKVIVRYPVEFKIAATYEAFTGFVGAFQRDNEFVSVEIENLAPDEGGGLIGTLRFVGVDLVDAPEEKKGPRRKKGRGWGGRR